MVTLHGVCKKFKIPHEQISSVRGHFINIFKPKNYTEFHALENVSFEVEEGDFFGIVGRNGSGKSTLLKIIAQIYEPTSGKVHINGKISPFLELGVGFNPELSARENVYVNGAILGMQKKQIDAIYDDIIEFAELEDFQEMKLKNFSSGMYVRLAFTVAIQAESDILLMDEVLAVGDQRFQEKCFKVFRKLKEAGKTIIFVSHDMSSIEKFCTKALLLEHGKIVEYGHPKKVTAKYMELNFSEELLVEQKENASHSEEEANNHPDRWGTGDMEVESVDFFDENHEKKQIFSDQDKELIVQVTHRCKKMVSMPVFGISIYDQNNMGIFITNTSVKNLETKDYYPGESAVVEYRVPNIFGRGTFTVSPAIANKEKNVFYDWRHQTYSFLIDKTKETYGGVDISHDITITHG